MMFKYVFEKNYRNYNIKKINIINIFLYLKFVKK